MLKKTYKNYLIESDGLKSTSDSYVRRISFNIKNHKKSVLFNFSVNQMVFDTKTITENHFIFLCLEKIKEVIAQKIDLINYSFEYKG